MNLMDLARSAAQTETAAEAELRQLVAYVSEDWLPGEPEEALAAALADPVDALICFRHLAQERREQLADEAMFGGDHD